MTSVLPQLSRAHQGKASNVTTVGFSASRATDCFSLATPVSNYFSQLIVLHYFECGANRADTVRWNSRDLGVPHFQQWLKRGPEFILSSKCAAF